MFFITWLLQMEQTAPLLLSQEGCEVQVQHPMDTQGQRPPESRHAASAPCRGVRCVQVALPPPRIGAGDSSKETPLSVCSCSKRSYIRHCSCFIGSHEISFTVINNGK